MASIDPAAPTPLSRTQRAREYYERNEHKIAVGFFVGGFLFDLVTLDAIDSWVTVGQQIVYLIIILAALIQMFFEELRPPAEMEKAFFLRRWYHQYRTAIIHFFFGNLLNLYTIFFFKSSSLLVSFAFMMFMVVLLILNESARFKALGLPFKFGLLSLCLFSFSNYIVPTFLGSIGTMQFLFSMLLGALPLVAVGWWVQTYRPDAFEPAKNKILLPMGTVLIAFLALYIFRLVPPVPLSIRFTGVYHDIKVTADPTTKQRVYTLSHERPWWKFWHNGDQHFLAQTNDKIIIFFRIFSPAKFQDQVQVKWFWYDNQRGWTLQDSIPIKIHGGRLDGYRGYAEKKNYQPGGWKVQIETADEREIGRVYFDLEIAPQIPRTFETVEFRD
ncbi:MAG: DUF2914 domain-containing protein [Bdellovibrionales bacterium]